MFPLDLYMCIKNQHKYLYIINTIIINMKLQPNEPTPEGYYRCIKCNYIWRARIKLPAIPVSCPECKSRSWLGENK